ncbi:UDP-N-acetylmuramate--L-alanine ligase [Demequina flava]|uniref:UDP-N-acetylmuramate--L-alanine ligase n=1 Tax=Demequina flava TaxID=1095025 RepID=UPI000780F473|nr:UDP-N-acetylmuramate--L-alanine ligase [Demequina flava]
MSRVHFIGVGGSGMSAVARLTAAAGHEVSGTDMRVSHYFEALRDAGMNVTIGHDAANVDGVDQVVISTAVRETNPELARARERGIEVVHRSEALARALDHHRLIAVAGSHGKTTTSAMVAHVLHGAGVDASFAVGARVFGIDGAVAGGYAGDSDIAVVEADESDGSFLRYHPEVAILLNVEPDHLDYYGTEERLHEAFTEFSSDCRVLVVCADDPTAISIARTASERGVEVISYGRGDGDVRVSATGWAYQGEEYTVAVPVPGDHMVLNAAAAWAASVAMGADRQAAARAVESFGGTGRRYQLRGEVAGITVVDDYAHHPTEVAALIAAARSAGAGHLVVLFQPALFSRTQLHAANFAAALSAPNADVVISGVHGDREDPLPGVNSQTILDQMVIPEDSTAVVVETLEDAAARVADVASEGDLVLTVGSGPVTYAGEWILDALKAREAGNG